MHPDKTGASLEQTIQLNGDWGRIQQRFKKHGHELWEWMGQTFRRENEPQLSGAIKPTRMA